MKMAGKLLLDIDLRVVEINFKTLLLGLTVGVYKRKITNCLKLGAVLSKVNSQKA